MTRSSKAATGADVVVVGGGIAGVSAAAELAVAGAEVVLLETEAQLGHHTTGRSAALFLETYGNPLVRSDDPFLTDLDPARLDRRMPSA